MAEIGVLPRILFAVPSQITLEYRVNLWYNTPILGALLLRATLLR